MTAASCPYKLQEDMTKKRKGPGGLAAANEISADAAVVALLSEPDGIFKDVLGGRDVFASHQ